MEVQSNFYKSGQKDMEDPVEYPYFESFGHQIFFGNQVIMIYSSTFKNKIQCGLLALKTEKNRELTCVANLGFQQ